MSRLGARLAGPAGRGTAWMSYAYAGGLVVQGAYFVALARLLGPGGLGAFAAALAIASVASPFAGWGAGNLLVRSTSRDPGAFPAELGAALASIALTGSVLAGLLWVLALTALAGTTVGAALLPLAVSELLFAKLVELAAQSFQAHDRLGVTANLNVGSALMRLVAIGLFAVLATDHTAQAWSLWYAGGALVLAVAGLGLVFARLGPPVRGRVRVRERARAGFSFSLGSASKSVYADIDKVMLARLQGDPVAGIYAGAYRVVAFGYAPVQAFVFASNTRFFRAGARGAGAVWALATRAAPLVWAYSLAAAACLWLAAPLLPLVLGEGFGASADALRWLAVMPLLQGTHYLFGDALMGVDRQGWRSGAQVGTALLNAGLNLWLIPALSFRGAALASIVAEGVLAVAMVALLWGLRRREAATPAAGRRPGAVRAVAARSGRRAS
jgi:O-antigen/teichoic acid export membrane protein